MTKISHSIESVLAARAQVLERAQTVVPAAPKASQASFQSVMESALRQVSTEQQAASRAQTDYQTGVVVDVTEVAIARQRAMSFLETRVAREEASGQKPSIWLHNTRDTLLEIHLAEKNAEAMWTTLKGGPTGSRLWEQCADLRGKTHPEDAIPLYFKLLPNAVNQGASNARYESAFRIVQSIGKLRKQQDRVAEFKQELARIRLEYKAKRNFIKLLSTLQGNRI